MVDVELIVAFRYVPRYPRLGVAMVLGYHLPFSTPRLDRGGRDRTLASMYVFGVSYAVASIGCMGIPSSASIGGSIAVVSGLSRIRSYGIDRASVNTPAR